MVTEQCVCCKNRSGMVGIFAYWKDVFSRAFRETTFFAWNKMFAGAAVSIMALGFQWWLGVRPWGQVWIVLITVLAAYVMVAGLSFISNFVRVPSDLDREHRKDLKSLKDAVEELSHPSSVLPEMMNRVREGWEKLLSRERDAIKLLFTHGDISDRVAIQLLHLSNIGNLYYMIEQKTNFVHRTEQGTQPHEHIYGYQGTWTINPHFREALQQLINSSEEPN